MQDAGPGEQVLLNVGGGSKTIGLPPHFLGWKHVLLDIDPRGGAEIVCDARALGDSVRPGEYDAVYCSHNLEHYYRHDVDRVLRGFLHALKDTGFAEIRVPDVGALIRMLAENDLDIEQEIYESPVGAITAHDMFYGYGPEIEADGRDFYAHKTGFTRESLIRALGLNGFREIYVVPPLATLELHAVAFKTAASPAQRAALSLDAPVRIEPRHDARLAARRPVHATSGPTETDPVEALYQRAVAAWSAGDWAGAEAHALQAISIDPGRAALHYLLGCGRLEQERLEAAIGDFERCLALEPREPLREEAAARRALCLARTDSRKGRIAPLQSLFPEDVQPVSIVICSAKPERYARAESMYRRLFANVPHEIIGIHDARSLAEGYNRALRRVRHERVLLSHDDVEIVSPDFAALLLPRMRTHGLLGVAGTTRMVGGAWHFAGHPHLRGQIGMRGESGGYIVTLYGVEQPVSAVQALDGMLLAVQRDVALRLGFDEAQFDAWHLYDLDFSLRAALEGVPCGTCNDILVVHDSPGRYDAEWLEYARRFTAKHRDRVGPMRGVLPQPALVSLPLLSADEWRLLTARMMGS